MRFIRLLVLLLALPSTGAAQTVAQGAPGTLPWKINLFSGTTIVVLPTALGTDGGFKINWADAGVLNITGPLTDVQLRASAVPVSLAAGFATSALQTTGNTSVASIDTKTPALGQALAAASTPVVLTAAQLITLTPPTTVTATGPLTDTQLRATAVPVSGTFFQATQPVSGTFFQATQPVSGTVTTTPPSNASTNVAQLAGTTTSVNSGVKDAGTLRVVLATDQPALTNKLLVTPDSVALPANQSVNVAQMGGIATSMNTGVRDTGTQRVTIATNDLVPVSFTQPALVAGSAVIGHVIVDTTSTTAVTQATGTNLHAVIDTGSTTAVTGNVAVTSAGLTNLDVALSTRTKPADQQHAILDSGTTTVTQATAANLNATVTQLALTKGTQGANGVSTQDLKDAGRNQTNYFMVAAIAATNTEVMQSLTGYKGGIAVATTVSPAVVTTAKTYRITSVSLSFLSLAAAGAIQFRLRANLSGAGVVGSPLAMMWTLGSAAAVAGITTTLTLPFPEGIEFPAGTGIAVGMVGLSAVGALAASGFGTITITGYEY